ncbi:MAG: PAS domain-containing protein [Anaerolineae bacterium]|nr:PAS domain-containing protein [Anaerolineae bacterium]
MALQRALYISPLVLTLFFSVGLAGFAWRWRRTVAGALQFFLLMAAVFVWDAAYICELFSPDLPTALFMVNVQYLGIASIPVLWLLYVLRYTGYERWAFPRWQIVWFFIPTLTILFSLTNPYHEWMRCVTGFGADGLFSQVLKIYGPWFWVHTVYSYVVLLVATTLMLRSAFFARGLVFGQKILLLAAVLLPWAGNALYIFGVSMLDLTPPAFAAMGLLMLVAVSRFQLFNIVPVARETLVDSMTDAVVVLNMENKVVDANPASEKITCLPVSKVIGMGAADVFTGYFGMITFYDPEVQVHNEIVVTEDAEPLYYDLQIIPLKSSHGRLLGRMVVLRDITRHRRAEEALQKLNEQLEEKVNERTDTLLRELAERKKVEEARRAMPYLMPKCVKRQLSAWN